MPPLYLRKGSLFVQKMGSTTEYGFADGKKATELLGRRLYALMSNQAAMDQLIALWNE
jgi:hypothetical protein